MPAPPPNPPASEATLLDYFAGQALEGVLSIPGQSTTPAKVAAYCYVYALAMLAARPV